MTTAQRTRVLETRKLFLHFRHHDQVKTEIAHEMTTQSETLNKVQICVDFPDLRLYRESLSRSSP